MAGTVSIHDEYMYSNVSICYMFLKCLILLTIDYQKKGNQSRENARPNGHHATRRYERTSKRGDFSLQASP